MNTEIQKYQIGNPLTVAEHFAKSGLFEDAKDMSKALVKILAGRELGLPDMASMTGIHIIKGKPVLGAGLIASLIKGSQKYDFHVIELNDKKASIDFFQAGKLLGNSTFTLEDATKAGTQNIQKFPKNMLYARAISNGAKWFCPDVFNGQVVYSDGEIEDAPLSVEPQSEPKFIARPGTISKPQQVRLFAIAKSEKSTDGFNAPLPRWTDEQLKDFIGSLGYSSSSDIKVSDYEEICEYVASHAGHFTDSPDQVKMIDLDQATLAAPQADYDSEPWNAPAPAKKGGK